MRATVFDIQRFSVHDGPGIRTTVFMKGCGLRCAWCHNPEGLSRNIQMQFFADRCIGCGECKGIRCADTAKTCPGEAITVCGREIETEELMAEVMRDRAFYGALGGVTFSGGECLLQSEFVSDMLSRLRAEGISTAVDTAGHVPWESIERTLDACDLYLYDVKCADPDLHKRFTGSDNLLILENLDRLAKTGARIWIRVPVIPGFNDSDGEMAAIAARVAGLGAERLTLMPYHTLGKSKYKTLSLTPPYDGEERVSDGRLGQIREIFEQKGIKVEKQ